MKIKNLILTVILIAICSCGTDQGEGTTYVYSVSNNSGVPIEVKSYISYLPDVDPIITTIDMGEEITKVYEDGLPPSGYSFNSFFGEDSKRDSIVVIFNNTRINYFNDSCSNARNPLNNCVYRNAEENFIFTEEDYQNSESCDGECE